jgi:hypothetical protein
LTVPNFRIPNRTQNFGNWIYLFSRVEKYLPVLGTVSLTGIKSLCDPENGKKSISEICVLFGRTDDLQIPDSQVYRHS